MTKFITKTVDGEAVGDWQGVYAVAAKHPRSIVDVREYNEAAEISAQQIRWWKGVLLPALSKDNGGTVMKWETKLKLTVMPDRFKPEGIIANGVAINCVPSITILSIKETNMLIEGSVAQLHDWGFLWVTLPDPELRKRTVSCFPDGEQVK